MSAQKRMECKEDLNKNGAEKGRQAGRVQNKVVVSLIAIVVRRSIFFFFKPEAMCHAFRISNTAD